MGRPFFLQTVMPARRRQLRLLKKITLSPSARGVDREGFCCIISSGVAVSALQTSHISSPSEAIYSDKADVFCSFSSPRVTEEIYSTVAVR